MSRRAVIALVTAMVLAFSVGTVGAAARDPGRNAASATTRDAAHDANRRQRPPKTAAFVARAGSNEAGRRMPLRLRIRHGDHSLPFAVSVVVHFASGDVTVPLQRRGTSLVAIGRVRIPAGEQPGAVPVDFTVGYGDAVQVISVFGAVEPPDDDDGGDTGNTGAPPSPAPATPAPTEQPEN